MDWSRKFIAIIFLALLIPPVIVSHTVYAASISGTVYQDNGATPITGESVRIEVYQGIPCCTARAIKSVYSNSSTGSYTVSGLDAGTYYLRAITDYSSGYFSEWWASGASVVHCNDSEFIKVAASDTISGIHFQLKAGATISGTVYEADGSTPISYRYYNRISVYTGDPCGYKQSGSSVGGRIHSDGTYTVQGLQSGTYYLQTNIFNEVNYLDEWWAGAASSRDCSQAQIITVADGQNIAGKNFQLSPGAIISGTVYQSDGTTPVTHETVYVEVYTGDPCADRQRIGSIDIGRSDGTYSLVGLAAGTYYLQTDVSYRVNCLDEWWAGSASTRDCSQAQAITVIEGATYSLTNFQLDPGATISGTVYQSDGTTPITGESIAVEAYTDDPCTSTGEIKRDYISGSDGTYTFVGLAAGTYYLQADPSSSSSHLDEWWAGAASSRDCSQAQVITVADGQNIAGKNFQLDSGATISGTIFHSDGSTPLTGESIHVWLYKGEPCNTAEYAGGEYIDRNNGSYTFSGLPSGTYFMSASSVYETNYVREWWADPASVRTCSQAQTISVTNGNTYPCKDFQLDPGAVICGTLYHSDGTTPITGEDISVRVYNTDPCTSSQKMAYDDAYSSTGTFAFFGLPDDTYFIHAASEGRANYIAEWWASPASVRSCSQAQDIAVTAGNIYTARNFKLDPGATISGTVFEIDGTTPVTVKCMGGLVVRAYAGNPCDTDNQPVSYGYVGLFGSSGSTYTIPGLPPGTYYLFAKNNPDSVPFCPDVYKDEWWAAPASVLFCSRAQPVTVTGLENITRKNFQLDPFKSDLWIDWILFIPAIIGH